MGPHQGDPALLLAVISLTGRNDGSPERHASQFAVVSMAETLALQPQDLHLLLHPRMGMVIPLVSDEVQIRLAEKECAHDCHVSRYNPFPADRQLPGVYAFRHSSAIVPLSAAFGISDADI